MLNTLHDFVFIAQNEAMIAFCNAENKIHYNVSYSGRLDEKEVVEIVYKEADECYKVVCIDIISNHVKDITEKVATAYIKKHLDDYEDDDYVPPFVANSDAWSEHLQYLEQQAAFDKKYGTYQEQHRLRLSDVI